MLLFIVCIVVAAAQGKHLSPRIFGGAVVTTPSSLPNAFDFIVSLQYNGKHFCTGTIFRDGYILTAAHCVYGLNYRMLTYTKGELELTGSFGEPVLMAYIHPLFNKRRGLDYDIAVLKVAETGVTPVRIYFGSPSGNLATLGWGPARNATDYIGTLRKGAATFIEAESCRNLLGGNYNRILCTSGGGGCYTDDGGPLLSDAMDRLYGVFSWGSGCVSNSKPQVFTNLKDYADFLTVFLI